MHVYMHVCNSPQIAVSKTLMSVHVGLYLSNYMCEYSSLTALRSPSPESNVEFHLITGTRQTDSMVIIQSMLSWTMRGKSLQLDYTLHHAWTS